MNQARIQQLWSLIAELEAQRSSGVSIQTQEQIDREIKTAKKEIADLEAADQAAEQAERAQQIEEKVASIALPYDFNDLYENSTANETIIEIVQQFQRQAYDEHNADIEQLTQLHKDQVRAANDREMQLQRQNDELQRSLGELKDELSDVRQSRDNAAVLIDEQRQEIDRLNSHINDLVTEQAIGAREAHKVIETNSTLNQLIEKANAEKQAKIKSAAELVLENGVPFRGKVELPDIKQQESQFRGEDSATQPIGDQLLYPEATSVEGPIFQTVQAPSVGTIELPVAERTSSDNGESAETPITRAELEIRLAQHKNEIIAEIMEGKVA